ncbi:MAG: hypothetical protein H6Q65_630 [Firmicutes bacterium]|nr:hypothetical protein [Bacillota bacterium]
MSAFLGPIHYWLYQKIKLVNDREQLLCDKAGNLFGETVEEIRGGVWDTYGSPPPDIDLAELIDCNNIHGWLQRQITLAEVREAALVRDLVDLYGPAATELAADLFTAQASVCGTIARKQDKYDGNSAAGIYAALNDVRLNGMPCDQADAVLENTVETVVWESGPRLQESSWKKANVDPAIMNPLYQNWLTAFVSGMNPEFTCQQLLEMTKGDSVNRWCIVRK